MLPESKWKKGQDLINETLGSLPVGSEEQYKKLPSDFNAAHDVVKKLIGKSNPDLIFNKDNNIVVHAPDTEMTTSLEADDAVYNALKDIYGRKQEEEKAPNLIENEKPAPVGKEKAVTPDVPAELPDLDADELRGAIFSQDDDEVLKYIDSALKKTGSDFQEDLTPEATNVDLLRGFGQRRQGKTQTMDLTSSGQFEGEKRAPFDIGRINQADQLTAKRAAANSAIARSQIEMRARELRLSYDSMKVKAIQLAEQAAAASTDREFDRKIKSLSLLMKSATTDLNNATQSMQTSMFGYDEESKKAAQAQVIVAHERLRELTEEITGIVRGDMGE